MIGRSFVLLMTVENLPVVSWKSNYFWKIESLCVNYGPQNQGPQKCGMSKGVKNIAEESDLVFPVTVFLDYHCYC